ncbi:hypothetical protein RB597_004357 [Gaeumannomyces tritici]
MASAQLMEEELQRSVMVLEGADIQLGDPESDHVDPRASEGVSDATMASFNEDSVLVANGRQDGSHIVDSVESEHGEDAGGDQEDGDQEDGQDHEDDDIDDDEEVGDDEEEEADSGQEDSEISDEDNDADEDVERHSESPSARRGGASTKEDVEEDVEEEDDDEGVGAVKIRPGETDDDSEDSNLSDGQSESSEESDGEAAWEEAVEQNEEDEDEEEEDEDDNIPLGNCMFCKDGDERGSYLKCRNCGENSHEECARNNSALEDTTTVSGNDVDLFITDAGKWRCPECASVDDVIEADGEAEEAVSPAAEESPSAPRSTSTPKLTRDLLPSQRGAVKADSHSVFNTLVLDDDPMDGSRVLRKRKTSSIEPEDSIMSLRKRRKDTPEEQSHAEDVNGGTEASTRPHSVRSLRVKTAEVTVAATVEKRIRGSIVIKFKASPAELRRINERPPVVPKRRGGRSGSGRSAGRSRTSRSVAHVAPPLTTPFSSTTFYQPFFFDKETEEMKGKPYGGILDEAEADTTKTFPQPEDRKRFDEAKQKAEEEWRQRILTMQANLEVPVKKAKKSSGPASQIECIDFGGWEIDTWYAAPYPEEYSRNRVLYICEFCLKYMNSDYVAWRHKLKCPAKHPPGDEIYRHGSVSVFEVDGRKNPVYCQNLCLLAKLFLGSKTLYYDVEPFLFYVLCEYDEFGYHFVGYFSKEKRASSQNNVSCILTLPIHQRKGYGNLLIDFSYLLTRVEKKTGSPEKPLSDMGLVSYRNYWRLVLCQYLAGHVSDSKSESAGLSIKQMSDDTGLTPDDVIAALEGLRCLVRDPQTELYAFRVDLTYCREYVGKWEAKKYVKLDPQYLTWTPYVMGRSNASNFELGPALNAIAPREEEDEPKPTDPAVSILPNGEASVVFAAAATDGVPHNSRLQVEGVVLESTEPSDIADGAAAAVTDGLTAAETQGETSATSGNDVADAIPDSGPAEPEWVVAYKSVPVTRFQVYPSISRRVERPRPVIRAPPIVQQPVTLPRPKPRRPPASRRSTTSSSKPKSSTTRVRKTGGTGRGPGRWPKGTKKSDYGNADSGPGLPPAWIAARIAAEQAKKVPVEDAKTSSKAKATGEVIGADGSEREAEDTVQVQTPTVKDTASLKGGQSSSVKSSEKRNGVQAH